MKKIVFVCLSHTLTTEQIADLGSDALVVCASPELSAKTRAIPAGATLSEIQALAAEVVAEALVAGATHFVCQGEPTFAMWANLMAGGFVQFSPVGGYSIDSYMNCDNAIVKESMSCITSTTERTSVDVPQPDGSVLKTAVFKHVQWRNVF